MKSKSKRRPLHRVGSSGWVADVLDCVPTNWCDELLTGVAGGIGMPPYDCRHIERLLIAIRERLRIKLKSATEKLTGGGDK